MSSRQSPNASTGRRAMPSLLMALVTVFQMLEKVPDRPAADYVVSRLDWKYALHLPLTYTGFHCTDLSAFWQRLLEHDQLRAGIRHPLRIDARPSFAFRTLSQPSEDRFG